jgi:hypothetical protein
MTIEETPISPLDARRAEVAQYDANIAMYEAIIATLPVEWPVHLEQFRGRTDHQAVAGEVENLDDVELLSQLLYRDQCKASIRAEKMERTKAAAILAVLEAQANG